MGIWESVVLGIVQGVCEFLPISSSAHLVILPWLFGWDYKGLDYDVALHMGTLCAVAIYFRKDFLSFVKPNFSARGFLSDERLWKLALATLPAGLAGVLLEKTAESLFRSPVWMAVNLMLFALLLAAADRCGKDEDAPLGYRQFFLIGCAQALSIMPGVSRSGITITAALFFGAARSRAARISFLLSVPVILGAGLLEARNLKFAELGWDYAAGFASAGISGWLAIAFLMDYVRNASYRIFVIYRLALGATLLCMVFLR
ncbi:MAG TPA: undecaprenyl-diphosphate phosphatase [Elusimicrobiales bacterium]|nr:undecaprenyl-diphosphate phosphatase [Elusimicrobiales bacterium]